MLKPQKRHSQTVSTKKPKPIQITLTKKPQHIVSGQKSCQENVNYSTEKVFWSGLSLIRPLKQKSQNISESYTFDLKSVKSKQLQLKQEVCPLYKLNWSNTPISNTSRVSQISTLFLAQQNHAKELNHLLKTVEYKKYTKEVQDTYLSNSSQFMTEIRADGNGVIESQSISNRQKNHVASINSVKSKIKGLTKGFLRDGKNVPRHLRSQERKSDQISRQILELDQNQSQLIQQPSRFIQNPNFSQVQDQVYSQGQKPTKTQCPSNLILIEENLTQKSEFKHHYAELSERLEQCVEQIVQIQKNNSVQKIVELENEIMYLKESHESERLIMQKRITDLEQQLALKQSERPTLNKGIANQKFQTDFEEKMELHFQVISTYETEIHNLRQKVIQLTSQLHLKSFQHDQSFSQQSRSSLEIQSQLIDIDIIKRKYNTLEQVLESKKKEILNKDSIIQMLLSKEVEKFIHQDPYLGHFCDQKDKAKILVSQMFGYMNGKLSNTQQKR